MPSRKNVSRKQNGAGAGIKKLQQQQQKLQQQQQKLQQKQQQNGGQQQKLQKLENKLQELQQKQQQLQQQQQQNGGQQQELQQQQQELQQQQQELQQQQQEQQQNGGSGCGALQMNGGGVDAAAAVAQATSASSGALMNAIKGMTGGSPAQQYAAYSQSYSQKGGSANGLAVPAVLFLANHILGKPLPNATRGHRSSRRRRFSRRRR